MILGLNEKMSILKINSSASKIQFKMYLCIAQMFDTWLLAMILVYMFVQIIPGNSIMFSPCSGDVFITVFRVISWRDHWWPGCITCANFTPGEGESQGSYSDGCSDSDVVTVPWPLISLLSPRLHFKSVCHEHHQMTLMSWNQRSEVLVQQLNVPVVLVSLYFITHDQKQYLNM